MSPRLNIRDRAENAVTKARLAFASAGALVATAWVGVETVLSAIRSLPATLIGTVSGAVSAAAGALTAAVVSWGTTAIATVLALIAGNLLIFGLVIALAGVAVLNPGGFRDEATWVLELGVLAVLGFVAARTVGPAVIAALPGVG